MDALDVLREVQHATEAMLQHRGWKWQSIPETWSADELNFLVPDHPLLGQVQLFFHVPDLNTLVIITSLPKLGMTQLRMAYDLIQRLELGSLQMVSRHNITTQTSNLTHLLPNDRQLSVIVWSLVLMYPMDHDFVPKHRKASREERRQQLPRGTTTAASVLPLLRADDTIAQYLGLVAGDVVRIERLDGSVYWRHVVGVHQCVVAPS